MLCIPRYVAVNTNVSSVMERNVTIRFSKARHVRRELEKVRQQVGYEMTENRSRSASKQPRGRAASPSRPSSRVRLLPYRLLLQLVAT